jgi:glutathionyl-hydroquinone reductase
MRMFPARPVAQSIRFGAGTERCCLPLLMRWLRRLGSESGQAGIRVGDTGDFDHIKRHYYQVHADVNPSRTVSLGPDLSGWLTPHGRDALGRCPFGDGTRPDHPPPAEAVPLAHTAV